MLGTSIYSVLFYGGALIILALVAKYLFGTWRSFYMGVRNTLDNDKQMPSWITPFAKTVLAVVGLIIFFTFGWNIKQSFTTHSSKYENPSETAEKKEVQDSQLPNNQELDRTRAEQKQRSEVNPHNNVLDTFDKHMEQEHEKIQKRSEQLNNK